MKYIIAVLLSAILIGLKAQTPAHINNSVQRDEATKPSVIQQVQAQLITQHVGASPQPVAHTEPESPKAQATAEVQEPMSNRQIGEQMASAKGWTGNQWLCLEKLWTNESNWQHTVSNYDGSGAYGIPQSLPASKMASQGADYLTNPRTQIAWGISYIESRYKNPCNALQFWLGHYPHWY